MIDLERHELFEHNQAFYDYQKLVLSSEHVSFFSKESRNGYEKHHVIPKHYFKSIGSKIDNSVDNCIWLSKSDHKYAHDLLFKCVKKKFHIGEVYYQLIAGNKDKMKSEILHSILDEDITSMSDLIKKYDKDLFIFDINFVALCEEVMRYDAIQILKNEIRNGYNPYTRKWEKIKPEDLEA